MPIVMEDPERNYHPDKPEYCILLTTRERLDLKCVLNRAKLHLEESAAAVPDSASRLREAEIIKELLQRL